MPICEALKGDNTRCGRGNDFMPYFWFHDSEGIFDKVFVICQDHSQENFNIVMKTEHACKSRIDERKLEIKKIQKEIKDNGASTKNVKLEHQLQIEFEKVRRLYSILNEIRNKTCRLCNFPLNAPANEKYQVGNKYSHADLHSIKGFRREVILFHTMCGRIWIMQTMAVDLNLKQKIMPSKTGQFTLEESLTSRELIVN